VGIVGLEPLEERHALERRQVALAGSAGVPEKLVVFVERLDVPERRPAVARERVQRPGAGKDPPFIRR